MFFPLVSEAHVKWFAKPVDVVPAYKITDSWVVCWIVVSFLIVLLGIFLEKKLKTPKFIESKLYSLGPIVSSLCSIGVGLALIIFTYNGFVFAPDMEVQGLFGSILLLLQLISGVMILFGLYERVGAIILAIVYLGSIKVHGLIEMLDAVEVLGVAIYVFIMGRPRWRIASSKIFIGFSDKLKNYAVPFLRVFTGLNLFVLGFSEKILAPSLTQNFLQHYNWNFMHTLGFNSFTNYWFAFSAGVVESLFGLFLILGLVTRLTTITLAVFLATTLVLLGPIELMGHLPHFSIAIVFLIMGSGEKLKLLSTKHE